MPQLLAPFGVVGAVLSMAVTAALLMGEAVRPSVALEILCLTFSTAVWYIDPIQMDRDLFSADRTARPLKIDNMTTRTML